MALGVLVALLSGILQNSTSVHWPTQFIGVTMQLTVVLVSCQHHEADSKALPDNLSSVACWLPPQASVRCFQTNTYGWAASPY